MQICPRCNSKLKKNTKFCPECGMAVIWDKRTVDTGEKKPIKGMALLIIALILIVASVVVFSKFDRTDILSGNLETRESTPIESTVPALAFSDDPVAISEASRSVVKVNCYDKRGELYTTGSGFASFADNVIVTNYHVIEGGVYSIEALTEDGCTFDIQYVLAMDEDKDIAILATETPHNLTLLQSGNSDSLRKGEKVVAIGSPLGLLNSVSTGVFSGYVNENGMDILQFTASISNGSSGGALFNDNGEVLGITFASYEAGQNLNLAIPANEVVCLYNHVSEPIAISDWYEENNAGYEYLMDSQFVEYDELISDPNRYHGELISVVGYAAYAEESVARNRVFLLPNENYKTWEDKPSVLLHGSIKMESYVFYWSEMQFEETSIIMCDDITHSVSVGKYADDYLVVTGIFSYVDGSATIDLLYAGKK